MLIAFGESLARMVGGSAESLHRNSRRWRRDLGCAEWWLGLCLLAWQRRGGLSELGYRSITDYAERALQLSGRKVGALLAVARALEHLPLFSNAYRRGEICWSKVRELQSLVTPETERLWLDFALAHRTDEVERAVAMSPNEWKRQKALNASLSGVPMVDARELERWLKDPRAAPPGVSERSNETQAEVSPGGTMAAAAAARASESAGGTGAVSSLKTVAGQEGNATSVTLRGDVGESPCGRDGEPRGAVIDAAMDGLSSRTAFCETGPEDRTGSNSEPTGDKHDPARAELSSGNEIAHRGALIRLQVEMTPDQFAVLESAERIARARNGRRLSRGAALAEIAASFVLACPARTRSRYLPLVRVAAGGHGWYETQRGMLPVDPEILAQALEKTPARKRTAVDRGGEAMGPQATRRTDSEYVATEPRGGTWLERDGPPPDEVRVEPSRAAGKRSGQRKVIPQATLDALYALAGHRCQCCGAMGSLTVHHKIPVSEGGSDELENLCLLCKACHRGEHESDFASKPHWRAAQEKARRGSQGNKPPGPPPAETDLASERSEASVSLDERTGLSGETGLSGAPFVWRRRSSGGHRSKRSDRL